MSSVALADWELDFEFWNVRVTVLIMCIVYLNKKKKSMSLKGSCIAKDLKQKSCRSIMNTF